MEVPLGNASQHCMFLDRRLIRLVFVEEERVRLGGMGFVLQVGLSLYFITTKRFLQSTY